MTGRSREPYPLEEPSASLGDLVSRIAHDTSVLVQDHIELAKAEIKQEVKTAGMGVGLMGGGAFAGWMAFVMLSAAAALALALVMDAWLGFLIVGVVWLVVAGGLAMAGRKELEEVDPAPRETIDELKEDKEWLKEQTH